MSRALPRSSSFAVFAFLFALATLSYHAQLRLPFGADLRTASFLAALLVLARPRSLFPLLALVVLQTLAIYGELPETNTNRLLQFFVGLTVLAAVPSALTRRSAARSDEDALVAAVRAPLQAELVVVYFWAFVHKINWGFLDPSTSCAVELTTYLPFVSGIPNAAKGLLVTSTLVVEASLAPLLAFSGSRRWGVRTALAFHFILGIAWFYSFSVTMVALLSLFVSSGELDEEADRLRQGLQRHRIAAVALCVAAAAGFVAMLLHVDPTLEKMGTIVGGWNPAMTLLQNVNAVWSRVSERLFLGVWYLAAVPVAIAWRRALGPGQPGTAASTTPSLRMSAIAWPSFVVPALVFVNGASPYLGWKTETSFAMYSNLRTEAGFENHVFLPSVPIARYQSDLVHIASSSDAALQELAEANHPVPLIVLRRRVMDQATHGVQGLRVRYTLSGVERDVANAESDPVLSAPLSYSERKFLLFRDIVTETCWH